ncbi:FKBP-type peptidyl-prolyl cis-trans isomerase [Paraflavitalea pollutisoli]|uniref:FKBP-type peptidyl-prolyl cis-trans isomerase n=1 Tax=Paraflavitalea pollutisoli TaxID=3034143 RepID=UPI0023EBCC66|nr:FKBP-type peptidyl-prolyl cis-trans isomerase [Paraflavitalea sp. H1-2-19X]
MRFFSIFLSVALAMTLWGCDKNSNNSNSCTPTTDAENDAAMQAYMTANGITGTKDPSGMYYQVLAEGTGNKPTINSRVTVNYTGKLTDGTVFDKGSNVAFLVSQVVVGWQIGLTKVAKGGKIKLVIPPNLGYGCKGSSPIPGNAVLAFDVDILDVK